jgi:L-lactate dehydrogenase complex protein LldG
MTALFETFKTRAEAVSAEVHRYPTKAEALGFIAKFLRAENVGETRAVWASDSFLSGGELRDLSQAFPGLSFEVTRERAAAARVGISELEWAISATGTLVTDAAPVARRLVSTLPEIHLAIVPTGGIQPDMASVFARLNPAQSAYISMITGPSRTADIERVLTIGVHGPSRLVIVFVDEMGINR